VLVSFVITPLLLTALSIGTVISAARGPELGEDDRRELVALAGAACADLPGADCVALYIARQMMLMLLVLPAALPSVVAAYSVVGEKAERTLEPLLATPIRTAELVAAKAIAAVVPAVLATWASAALFVGAVAAASSVAARVVTPAWVLALAVGVPLVALLSVFAAMLISCRSVDPRSAQQVAGVVVLPVVGLVVAQAFGVQVLTLATVAGTCPVLALVDALLLWIVVQWFEREAILTRWSGL
jgi:ABC-2 type transport system permease protein